MSRYIIVSIVALAMIAPMTMAADPPDDPWGTPPTLWGTDCDDWIGYYNPFTTPDLIYRPGEGYYVCGDTLYDWPDFQIDVFFELEIMVHFDWTLVQVHRVSNYDSVEIVIGGWIEQNGGNYIIMTTAGMVDPNGVPFNLNQLNFIEDVLGRNPPSGSGTPIPVTWWYSLVSATGPWCPMDPDPPDYVFLVPDPCTHEFWIRIVLFPYWHQEDGWYKLGGEFCPLANL